MQRNTTQRRNILEIIRQKGHATLPEIEEKLHFICLKCGKIVDIPKKKTNIKSLEKEGKLVEEVVTIYYGLCDDCNKCM